MKTWAGPLAAIGTVSMALLQVAKNALPLRSRFQLLTLRKWMGERCDDVTTAEKDLIKLTMAGDAEAFYDSSIEDLSVQMKGAVPLILDYPDRHEALLRCLARESGPGDIDLLLSPPPADVFLKPPAHCTPDEKEAIRQYAAAKTRVGRQVRCAIDAIQARIEFRWKRRLQILSHQLSAVLGFIAVLAAAKSDAKPGIVSSIGVAIMVGFLAGCVAPVARDLVAAVEKWRS